MGKRVDMSGGSTCEGMRLPPAIPRHPPTRRTRLTAPRIEGKAKPPPRPVGSFCVVSYVRVVVPSPSTTALM